VSQLQALGLKTKFAPYWSDCDGYLAGTDQQRAQSLMDMFSDSSISMIMASRGGWGCARIIDLLDYSIIRANPKPFIGFSDLTACLNAITQQTGMVTFHVCSKMIFFFFFSFLLFFFYFLLFFSSFLFFFPFLLICIVTFFSFLFFLFAL
jgi:muramoyltetrapeptide carboxypeptidase LdcA involved in peptidoglycan recycling